jgi:hypothetical protein
MQFLGGDQKAPAVSSLFDRSEGKTHNGDGSSVVGGEPNGAGVMHELGHALGFDQSVARSGVVGAPSGPASAASGSGTADFSSLMAYPSSLFAGLY